MANLERTMFREYDLRGRVNDKELNEDTVRILAKAYGTMLRRRDIEAAVVGHDYRKSSERLTQAAIEGLVSTGVNVISLSMILTPMMYSAQYHHKTEGGLMVTASHNPSGWSGLKLALGYSYTFGPEEMEELYELTISEDFASGNGTVQTDDFTEHYTVDLLKRIKMERPMKVVVNTGNGTAGAFVPSILRRAGCEVVELYCNLDWDFPVYFPNPSLVEMMEDTGQKVVETGADIGLAIDGDGDRLGITDERGQVVWPDRFLILLSRQVLEKHPGAKIIFDVKCSQALPEDIEAHGGIPIMWKTGHSHIKKKVQEEKAVLGGEMSGHIFISQPEYHGFDDGVFAALKLTEYLSQQTGTMSEVIANTPYYASTPALQAACADEVKYAVVEKLTQEFKADGYEVNDINGARVNFGDGWGLVRASSNLPVLVLRFEAKTQERLDEIIAIFRQKLSKYPEIGEKWESG
ncbi:MAG TPA: phosphomannomutase/phosphoglucomutase [Anaerolineae bacterium]|nr:phosphomannomutase/phosphoglucomutase [Anaerolineae bacterium]